MNRIGGWFTALVTMLASLVLSVALAGAALAAGVPAGGKGGSPPELTGASGDWLASVALLATLVAATAIVVGSSPLRRWASRRREAKVTPTVTS